jgi:hypothetical protein
MGGTSRQSRKVSGRTGQKNTSQESTGSKASGSQDCSKNFNSQNKKACTINY